MLAPRTARKPIVAGTDSESGGISPAGDSSRPARDNTYMPDWSFRYRFKLGAGMSIATDSSELFLTEPDAPQRVAIRSVTPAAGDPNVPISARPNLVLRGSGFATRQDAQIEAVRWLNALLLGFAANNLGADFALRDPESVVPVQDLQDYATEAHPVVLPDDHKLMIFETTPAPLFVKLDIGPATVHKGIEHLLEAIKVAYADETEVAERHLRAYTTYSSSFGMAPDARLITLVSAAEVLLEHQPRIDDARAFVVTWIEAVENSLLPKPEEDSLRGSLNYMLNESIGRSISRLAASLGQRTYAGEQAGKFLRRCYTLRSELVHGTQLPHWLEVQFRNAELERLVGDLIAVALLDKFDVEPAQTFIGATIAPDWNGDPAVSAYDLTCQSRYGLMCRCSAS